MVYRCSTARLVLRSERRRDSPFMEGRWMAAGQRNQPDLGSTRNDPCPCLPVPTPSRPTWETTAVAACPTACTPWRSASSTRARSGWRRRSSTPGSWGRTLSRRRWGLEQTEDAPGSFLCIAVRGRVAAARVGSGRLLVARRSRCRGVLRPWLCVGWSRDQGTACCCRWTPFPCAPHLTVTVHKAHACV